MSYHRPDITDERRDGRILIVEDEKDFALILADTLESRGYQIEIAHCATSGREKAQAFAAQVALLDIRLGHESGIDLIAELEEVRPGVLCVMMTADAAVDTAIKAIHRGAYDYLPKPLDMRRLLATLDRCFEKLRLESEKAAAENALKARNTELLKMVEEVRESEERYRTLFETMVQGVVYQAADGEITSVNPAAERILGLTLAQMQGRTSIDPRWKTVHEDGSDFPGEAHPSMVALRSGEETLDVMMGVFDPQDDAYRWINVSAVPQFRPGESTPYQAYTIFADITERVRAEEQVRHLRNYLKNIIDSMPSVLVGVDLENRITQWNREAEKMTGVMAGEAQGRMLTDVLPELAGEMDRIQRAIQNREPQRDEKVLRESDGEIRYSDVTVYPLVANGIEGAVIRLDDVTDRVRVEEMMLQSTKMASVGRLAAGVAHEINNPLGIMVQGAQMLQLFFDTSRPPTRERLQRCGVDLVGLERYLQERGLTEYLDGIRAAGVRAAKIVADLLNFSRTSSSKAALHDVNVLVERTLDLAATDYDLKKKYDFRDIEVLRELAPDLPEVMCDGQQIQQVALNLVRNAAQALSEEREERVKDDGDYQPRLTLRTTLISTSASTSAWVRLEVKDNGAGMSEAVRARLFDPFFTTKEVGEGTGLGLWLCWSIVVERHGGRIWEEPVADGGSRFVVELPVV